jgi:tape measure domain-containing protein
VAGEVGIKIKVSAKDADRNLNKLKNSSNRLQESFSKLQKRSNGAANNIRKTGLAAKTASKGVNALNRAVRNLVLGFGAFQAGKFVIFQAAQLETQTKALTVLTGSAEKAKQIVQEIKEFGAVTPFKSSELIEVAKRMKAFGFETEEVVDITKRIADVAGTAGADINNVALAIGKVQAKNKFMQEENVMLLEKGINVTKELEKIMGMNGETLAKAMSKGEVGADKFVQALINLTSKGGEFFEGASKQSDTLAGKFSTLVDNVETFAQNLGKLFEPGLKFILDELNKIASEFNKIVKLLTDSQIGASNRNVGSAAFKARFGLQSEAVEDVVKAVSLLDTTFIKSEEDAQKLIGQLDRISNVIKLVRGPDSPEVLDRRGLLDPIIEAINQIDILRTEVAKIQQGFNQTENAEKNEESTENVLNTNKFINTELDKRIQKGFTLNEGAKKLNQTLEKQSQIQQEITNILASGMTNAVMGLIDGTRTLGQALADIAKQLASMFLNKAFSSLFSNMFGGGIGGGGGDVFAGFNRGPAAVPTMSSFSTGGYVSGPTMGLVGEAGESEYVIPASKMSGAMSRYSAGARGGAVIPGGSHESGTVAGSSGNTVVEYTGPTLNFNGDEYVPKSAVPEIIGAATKQGAMAGKAQVLGTLRNSRSQRASLGL